MAQEEQQVLYDFLYKDIALLESCYAQIYHGLLKNYSQEDSSNDSMEGALSGSIPTILKAQAKGIQMVSGKDSRHFIPHDTIVLDIMQHVGPHLKTLDGDRDRIKRGDLVIANAPLHIFAKTLLLSSFDIMSSIGEKVGSAAEKKQAKELSRNLATIKKIFEASQPDLRYVMKSENAYKVEGSLKEEALTVTVSSLVTNFGHRPINPVKMIGLVELMPGDPSPSMFKPNGLNHIMLQILEQFNNMITEGEPAIVVKPFLIFNEINCFYDPPTA